MTQTTNTLSTKSQSYLDAAIKNSAGNTARENALEVFKNLGLPTKKNENYKYTNIDKVFPDSLNIATPDQVTANTLLKTPGEFTLVFDNGEYEKTFSQLPEGLSVEEVASSEKIATDPMEALHHSLVTKHYKLTIAKNTQLPLVTILQRLDGEANQIALTSLEVRVETGAQAEFLEVFHSQNEIDNASLTQTSFHLGPNAIARHTKALLTKNAHAHVGKVQATLERDSNFTSLTFSVDGKLNRNNVEVFVEGTGAHATVNGLYTGRASQHQDCFTLIHHKAPHTTSEQVFKGILDDEARGVFTGKIVIHRDAQQVDSNQLNKNLLLSKKAHVDTRPQIEVYADDVKCGHGATVGQINEEEVFYLESRGIPKDQAQKILCHAFAFEAVESCGNAEVSQWLGEKLFELFEKFALEELQTKLK